MKRVMAVLLTGFVGVVLSPTASHAQGEWDCGTCQSSGWCLLGCAIGADPSDPGCGTCYENWGEGICIQFGNQGCGETETEEELEQAAALLSTHLSAPDYTQVGMFVVRNTDRGVFIHRSCDGLLLARRVSVSEAEKEKRAQMRIVI